MGQRERLVEAAITCLRERGYARTTTRDIVAAAGAHVPAVNYYFGSKKRLLDTAIVEGLRRWADAIAVDAGDVSLPGDVRLRAGLQSLFDLLDGDPGGLNAALEAFAQAPRDDELRARLAGEYQRVREQTAGYIAELAPEGTDAADAASVLMALFDGLAVQRLLDPDRTPDADRALRALADLAETVETRSTSGDPAT